MTPSALAFAAIVGGVVVKIGFAGLLFPIFALYGVWSFRQTLKAEAPQTRRQSWRR